MGSKSQSAGTPDYSNIVPQLAANYDSNNTLQHDQYQQAQNNLSTPLNFANLPQVMSPADMTGRDQMSDAVYQQQEHYLDPQFQQAQSDLESKLANQGIMEGSDAYNREMNNFNLQKQAAYGDARDRAIQQGGQEQTRMDNLGLQIRNQAINERLAERNAPLQDLNTLNGINTATTKNLFDASNGLFNANLGNLNASNAANQGMWGGLFGLGSAALQNPNAVSGLYNWSSGLFGGGGSAGNAYDNVDWSGIV
jgi:hypothetical protein